jgi:hypothetical protein
MLYHAVPESLKHTLPLVHRVSRYQDRMLCPSEEFAYHYSGAAICNPTASGPVVTRSTRSSSVERLLSASAVSSRQTESASEDMPDAVRLSSLLDIDPAASCPMIRWRLNAEYGADTRPLRTEVASARSSDGANDRSGSFTCHSLRKERSPEILHGWDDQCPIKKVVLLLATRL